MRFLQNWKLDSYLLPFTFTSRRKHPNISLPPTLCSCVNIWVRGSLTGRNRLVARVTVRRGMALPPLLPLPPPPAPPWEGMVEQEEVDWAAAPPGEGPASAAPAAAPPLGGVVGSVRS